jgi:hypothetical protein
MIGKLSAESARARYDLVETSSRLEPTKLPQGVRRIRGHRGLYGAFVVDPKGGRPSAHEMVMVMNAFDTNFDNKNEVYALNTVAFA